MTEAIASALSADEWLSVGRDSTRHPLLPSTLGDINCLSEGDLPKAIAVANDALPVESVWKITQEDVAMLNDVAQSTGTLCEDSRKLLDLASKLTALVRPVAS